MLTLLFAVSALAAPLQIDSVVSIHGAVINAPTVKVENGKVAITTMRTKQYSEKLTVVPHEEKDGVHLNLDLAYKNPGHDLALQTNVVAQLDKPLQIKLGGPAGENNSATITVRRPH